MTVDITLTKRKYRTRPQPKAVKNQSSGNGKHAKANKVSWKAGTGTGDKGARR